MTILVDTSVLRDVRTFERLVIAAKEHGHRILIPTLVRAERDFQTRRVLATKRPPQPYSAEIVHGFYARFEGIVGFLDLDVPEADAAATRLSGRFPSDEAWKYAKRAAAISCVGEPATPPGEHRACGAPLDWYLAAQASPERPMVTKERPTRPEWAGWEEGSILDVPAALERLAACP